MVKRTKIEFSVESSDLILSLNQLQPFIEMGTHYDDDTNLYYGDKVIFVADSRLVYFLNEEETIGGTLQRFVCSHSLKEDDTYIIKRHRKIKHEIYI